VTPLPPLPRVPAPATPEDVDELSLYNVLRAWRFAEVGSLPLPVLDRLRERMVREKREAPLGYAAASRFVGWLP